MVVDANFPGNKTYAWKTMAAFSTEAFQLHHIFHTISPKNYPFLRGECVAAKHGVYFPRVNICLPLEDLSDGFSIAHVKVAANIT